ncbi:MAG TPA: hypothetical protein VIH34_02310 [Candidatus Bathyarchaeia archaeon]
MISGDGEPLRLARNRDSVVIFPGITLSILVLFFLAIVSRK